MEFYQLLEGNKELLTGLLRKFWKTHNVQNHINTPDEIYRKSAAILHFGLAEITKLKYSSHRAKQDKSLIHSMKDLYFKTLRVYSHSGKVCENLASRS